MKPAIRTDIKLGRRKTTLEPLLKKVLNEKVSNKAAIVRILEKLTEMALKGDIKAAELLIDRAYGKPKQQANTPGSHPVGIVQIQYILPEHGNNNQANAEAAPMLSSAEVIQ